MVFENLLTDTTLLSNIILLLALWELPWQGVAMWMAARRKHRAWFIVFLLVNILAIPEILYIFVFSKYGRTKIKKKR
jgi:hypothetical protein